MLCGYHHGVDAFGQAILILDRYLWFAVRPQVIQKAAFAHVGQPLGQFVRIIDGGGHQRFLFRRMRSRT